MKRRLISIITLIAIIVCISTISSLAVTRNTDVSTPGKNCSLVLVPGEFEKANIKSILQLINNYRKEACQNGYINPDTGQKLTKADYVEIKWSVDLESFAQIRAAEAAVYPSHSRTGPSGYGAIWENLAWTWGGITDGIEMWYEEKEDWVKQNSNAVTGHYESMISPSARYVGIGGFASSAGVFCVAGEFSSYMESLDDNPQVTYGKANQKMEVWNNKLSKPSIGGSNSVVVANKTKLSIKQDVTYYTEVFNSNVITPLTVTGATWSVSDKRIATVDKNGVVIGKKPGKVTVTAKLPNGMTAKKTITVVNALKSLWASKHEVGKVTFKWTRQPGATASNWKVKYRIRKIGGNNAWGGWMEKTYRKSVMQATISIPKDYVIELHAKGSNDFAWSQGIITTPAGGKYQAMKYAHVKNPSTNKKITQEGKVVLLNLKVGQSLRLMPDHEYPVRDYVKRPRLYPTHMLYDVADSSIIGITKPNGSKYTGGIIDGIATVKALKAGSTTLVCRAPNGRTNTIKITVKK